MKTSYSAPRQASWKFVIDPWDDRHLVEDAPHDENTRAIYQLVEPIRNWLAENRHTMTVDRGDWGEGDEIFHISFSNGAFAEEFQKLCESLKK
jgi:hypothetical protein